MTPSSQSALSVCTYDPVSDTVYSLIEPEEQDSTGLSAASSNSNANKDQESQAPKSSKVPSILQMSASKAPDDTEEVKGEAGGNAQNTQFRSMRDHEQRVVVYDAFKAGSAQQQADAKAPSDQATRGKGAYSQIMRFS